MKTRWSLIAAIAVCLSTLTRAPPDVLVFTFNSVSINFNSESLEQFHNCLCDSRSKMCTVMSSFQVTLQSVLQDSLGLPYDDYTSIYQCQIDPQDETTMICTRTKNTAVCHNHYCHSVCFTNRSSCTLRNVSTIFVFDQVTTMRMDSPGTLMQGLCQAYDIPVFAMGRSRHNFNPSVVSSSEGRTKNVSLQIGYLGADDFDCSNVCPSAADIQFFDWVTIVAAFLLYVYTVVVV